MEEKSASELVRYGMGTGAHARSCKGGWSLAMGFAPVTAGGKLGLSQFEQLERSRGGPRVFKTLEALVACASRIGFKSVSIQCSEIAVRPPSEPSSPPVRVTREQARRLKQMARKK